MNLIIMLLLLSVLILIHELGHFLVAKAFGIKVDRFGFGLPFGPTLFEKKIGDTIVCVHAFLLGGYVSFPDDDPESELPKDHPDRISNRPIWQRFCVISAGVIANAILAYLIVVLVAFSLKSLPAGKYEVFLNGVTADKNMPAHSLNIKQNDRVVSINGLKITNPSEFIETIKRSKKFDNFVDEAKITSEKEKIKKLNPTLKLSDSSIIPANTEIKLPKVSPEKQITLSQTYYLKPYKEEGVKLSSDQQKLRDEIDNKTSYKTDKAISLSDLASAVADSSHPISIVIKRNGKDITLETVYPNEDGLIGVQLAINEVFIPVKGIKSTFIVSWDYLYRNTYLLVDGLVKLFTGKVAFENLHGIVAITKVGSDIIEHKGIWDGLLLTALISIDLAIVNLLPIPALDGGHLMFLSIEAITRRKVDENFQEQISKFFFLLLIVLMLVIIFNDIFALVTKKI